MPTVRGFEDHEYKTRTANAQSKMVEVGLSALLLTTETDVRYFTGFLTRFWESPTRPWFAVIPSTGAPIAVIPSIGADLMAGTWIADIRTWQSPDLKDDGISLLCDVLSEVVPNDGQIGIPDGHETHVRMPIADLLRLQKRLMPRQVVGDCGILRDLRMVKSDSEIAKIESACQIAGRAFDCVPEIAKAGTPLDVVFRKFQMLCLDEGADWVPYLAGGAEQGGYSDVISPASPKELVSGDILMLDTGLVFDGYFCDYDRNWSIGRAKQSVIDAYKKLIEASDAAFELARRGKTAAELFHVMNDILSAGGADTGAGRLGHGLGMSLTEWPSLIPTDHTELKPGMVLTLEPGIAVEGKILVHEENIVITETGARFLSPRANGGLPQL